MNKEEVTIVLPALNEGPAVRQVISDFQDSGYHNILVCDGGSTDGTADIASECGAQVITQDGNGKGQAVRQAVEEVETEYFLMCDCDLTYDPCDADRMVKPLFNGYCRTVGNRFAQMEEGSMSPSHKLVNKSVNILFRLVYGTDFGDILSGYQGFKTDIFHELNTQAMGFEIECEISARCANRGVKTRVVPIKYHPRAEGTSSKIRPVRDTIRIVREVFRNAI